FAAPAERTMLRIVAFIPGASPPPVSTPMRRGAPREDLEGLAAGAEAASECGLSSGMARV
ncbi:MAG TPA: hypothetical protein VGI47_09970, partial [Candidatus Binataceae bacterium]